MPDILPVLLALTPVLSKTTCRQLHCIVLAMLAMTGRITQLGLSRWTQEGGSYRTVHRFFHAPLDWLEVQWRFFTLFHYDPDGVYILAGDESVIGKAGKQTFGIDRFFSSLADKAIPGIACFSMALVHTKKRQAYSLCIEQVVRTQQEKEQAQKRRKKTKAQKKKGTTGKFVGRLPRQRGEPTCLRRKLLWERLGLLPNGMIGLTFTHRLSGSARKIKSNTSPQDVPRAARTRTAPRLPFPRNWSAFSRRGARFWSGYRPRCP